MGTILFSSFDIWFVSFVISRISSMIIMNDNIYLFMLSISVIVLLCIIRKKSEYVERGYENMAQLVRSVGGSCQVLSE